MSSAKPSLEQDTDDNGSRFFRFQLWSSSLGHQHNLSKIALSYGYMISPQFSSEKLHLALKVIVQE